MTMCLPTKKLHFVAYLIPFTMDRSLLDISLVLSSKSFINWCFLSRREKINSAIIHI